MPGDWFGPGPLHKVVVSMDRPDLLILLVESQAVVSIEDYGAFAVMEIDENAHGGAARPDDACGRRPTGRLRGCCGPFPVRSSPSRGGGLS